MRLLTCTNYLLPPALRHRLMMGNAYTRGYSLHQVQQEEKPQQEKQEFVLSTPAFGTKHTHAPTTDPSQTPVAARPSMVPTASELSVEKCPPPSLKLSSCFFHQQPQNQLFHTPCFIWEYCPTATRGMYLNLTRGVESLLEAINWFEFGGTSYIHHHVVGQYYGEV